jgi:iron complex outermembrane receptor protein
LASAYPNTVRRDASGRELPNAPKFSGNVLLAYEIPVGRFNVTPALDVVHRGSSSGDITPENFREEYTLAGLRVALGLAEKSPWRTQFWVRNLTDEQYYVSGQAGGNFTYARTMGMPRTWGVTFEYNLQ